MANELLAQRTRGVKDGMNIPDIHKDMVGSSCPKDQTLQRKEDCCDVSSAMKWLRHSNNDSAE